MYAMNYVVSYSIIFEKLFIVIGLCYNLDMKVVENEKKYIKIDNIPGMVWGRR